MGAAESTSSSEDTSEVPESFEVRVSTRLLERLQAADESPDTVVTMSGAERRQLVEAAYQEGATAVHAKMVEIFRNEQESQNQELTELQDRVEHPALDAVEAKVQRLHDREYRAPTRDVPCADERAECLRCYGENAGNPLKCAETVAALDQCAQAVRRVHLEEAK
mmetsp:Transcript_26777/g.72246  ORF Transcript_26777/g.72246 Transcript_26777/m.72246 type:complete len:165 (-) Transcript_26777:369-863(-)